MVLARAVNAKTRHNTCHSSAQDTEKKNRKLGVPSLRRSQYGTAYWIAFFFQVSPLSVPPPSIRSDEFRRTTQETRNQLHTAESLGHASANFPTTGGDEELYGSKAHHLSGELLPLARTRSFRKQLVTFLFYSNVRAGAACCIYGFMCARSSGPAIDCAVCRLA